MKSTKFIAITAFAFATTFSVIGCNKESEAPVVKEFDFSIGLKSGREGKVYLGTPDKIVVTEINADATTRNYTFKTVGNDDDKYMTVTRDQGELSFTVTPNSLTESGKTVQIRITETVSQKSKRIYLSVNQEIVNQNAGVNYSADTKAREEILGKLEEYAMESSLTGITLFQEGAYVRYNDRVRLAASKYITGYGLGVLSEGWLTGPLEAVTENKDYLHSASSSDPMTINAWDATGSQVSDLNSYIASSYWSTKMKDGDSYEWYPLLAKDKVNGKDFNRPIPLEYDGGEDVWNEVELTESEQDKSRMFKRWRVYVKTGEIAYRTASTLTGFKDYNNRAVSIEDYEFVFQMLLTEGSKISRGTELALDTSYGIKGGQSFYRRTKNKTDAEATSIWKSMQDSGELGIVTGNDAINGDYIDIELLSPVNAFYGMYYLASNLYTPIPKSFMQLVGGGSYQTGAKLYGTFGSGRTAIDNSLCLGAFYLKTWDMDQQQVFARNDSWYECAGDPSTRTRYKIPGLVIHVVDSSNDADAAWKEFNIGKLDSAALPQSYLKKSQPLSTDIQSVGDATFKLNVNACTQAEWNDLFGTSGKVAPSTDNAYLVKPWMSNTNFLKGLYWSMNREAFAKARGVLPSINYFADAYMSDGEKGISYNSTEAHQNAIKNFHNVTGGKDDYGFDLTIARSYFAKAINELGIAKGTKADPTIIKFKITWMNKTDPREYGDEIVNYFEAAFNDDSVAGGTIKLVVEQESVEQWDQVYTDHLMVGKFDLGFGAISGNTLNPLNFMEVLKSDNSSGFTLNWGTDTGVVDEVNPIIYDGKAWSYDALWAAADHGAVVDDGKDVDPVDHFYMTVQTGAANELYLGGTGATLELPFGFVDVTKGVELELSEIVLYLASSVPVTLDATKAQYKDGKITITISAEDGAAWNNELVVNNKLDEAAAKPGVSPEDAFNLLHPFTRDNYGFYWEVEVKYNLTIEGGIPSENTYAAARSKAEDDKAHNRQMKFAR